MPKRIHIQLNKNTQQLKPEVCIANAGSTTPPTILNHNLGLKNYELSNHLGNVTTVISDRKIPRSVLGININFYMPDIVSATDYYPFGMTMQERTFSAGGEAYRFGFNGKENDAENNTQDYDMRIYDGRLGRFLSLDPLMKEYPWNSTYAFAENDVIRCIDLEGAEKFIVTVNNKGAETSRIELPNAGSLGDGVLLVQLLKDGTESKTYLKPLSTFDDKSNSNALTIPILTPSIEPPPPTKTYLSPITKEQIENKKSFAENWSESDNIIAGASYNLFNNLYVTAQAFDFDLLAKDEWNNPFTGGNFGNLDGTPCYNQTGSLVHTIGTVLPLARGTQIFKTLPKGIGFMNKLSAPAFSKIFKGTLSKLTPSTRGIINKGINKGIGFVNNQISNGMILFKAKGLYEKKEEAETTK